VGKSYTSLDIHFHFIQFILHYNFVRTPNESEPLPSELKEPIAIANDLLNLPPPVGDSAVIAVGSQSGVPDESNSVSENGEETLGKVRLSVV
jgi:hypothetical protein